MKQEQLIPDVELSQEQMDTINENVERWRTQDDGEERIERELQRMYTVILDREKETKSRKEDTELALALAFAREEYDYCKAAAERTVEDQKGFVPPEPDVNPLEGMEIAQPGGRKMVLYDPSCGGCSYLLMAEGETAAALFGRRLANDDRRVILENVDFDPDTGDFQAAIKAPEGVEAGAVMELGMKFTPDFAGVAEAKTVTKDATGTVTKEETPVVVVEKAPQAAAYVAQVEEKAAIEAAKPVVAYKRELLKLDPEEITALREEVEALRKEGPEKVKPHLKEAYRYYTEYNIALKADIENLDMQYKTNYLWTRYSEMKKYNE